MNVSFCSFFNRILYALHHSVFHVLRFSQNKNPLNHIMQQKLSSLTNLFFLNKAAQKLEFLACLLHHNSGYWACSLQFNRGNTPGVAIMINERKVAGC